MLSRIPKWAWSTLGCHSCSWRKSWPPVLNRTETNQNAPAFNPWILSTTSNCCSMFLMLHLLRANLNHSNFPRHLKSNAEINSSDCSCKWINAASWLNSYSEDRPPFCFRSWSRWAVLLLLMRESSKAVTFEKRANAWNFSKAGFPLPRRNQP